MIDDAGIDVARIDVAGRHPNCPITGQPAVRLIQPVSSKLLSGLWKVSFGVATGGLLGHVRRFGLWESPCGLAFFDPMIAGDTAFYARVYGRMDLHAILSAPGVDRPEFSRAASLVTAGAMLLDVGGGEGGFSRYVPQARYVGLDPNAGPATGAVDLRAESVADHARENAGAYDVACAFQVVEHVVEPLAFVADMVTCLKPGGNLVLGVPRWTSPMTDIPNFVFNAPPHHLSWWTEDALRALCARLDLAVESVELLPVGSHESILYWMGRLSPKLTRRKRFFRAHWSWYGALAWAWAAGRVADWLFKPPPGASPMILFLSARKKGKQSFFEKKDQKTFDT